LCCHFSTIFYWILLSLPLLCSYILISLFALLSGNLSTPLYPSLLFPISYALYLLGFSSTASTPLFRFTLRPFVTGIIVYLPCCYSVVQ
jgi:hypothetical protein